MILSAKRFRVFALLATLSAALSVRAATPGFKISATDVKISGQGTASTTFTLTSTNGFTGKVEVYCQDLNPNLFPNLILAQCGHPTQTVTVPAGGSTTGTIEFYPPWTTPANQSALVHSAGPQRKRHAPSVPLTAGIFVGLGLLGLRCRRFPYVSMAILGAVAALSLFWGVTGCAGHPGLAMTPGAYIYTIHSATPSNVTPSVIATTTITVKVDCNSCP